MSNIPNELKYSTSHEWVRVQEDGTAIIGITDHAQHLLGDMVFVELPETDTTINAGDESGVVESVKSASDLYSPISGQIVEVNEALADSPALVNSDPYGDGWIFKLQLSNTAEVDELLDADAYSKQIAEEA